MKKISILLLAAGAFLFTSCGAFKSYVANYSVGLATVESPADAKQQFGETKVVNFDEDGIYQEDKTGWQTIDEKEYYLDEEGKPVTGWQTIEGKTYCFNKDGLKKTGWLQAGKNWY